MVTSPSEYNGIIEEQLHQGIVERIQESQEHQIGQTHYLPNQAGIRKDAITTKTRVVFETSAKISRSYPSLNDCIYTGPSLTPVIFDILLRFRRNKV
jgi:hypothetical protein